MLRGNHPAAHAGVRLSEVEDDQLGVARRHLDELALTAREARAAFADRGLEAVGQARDHVVERGTTDRGGKVLLEETVIPRARSSPLSCQ